MAPITRPRTFRSRSTSTARASAAIVARSTLRDRRARRSRGCRGGHRSSSDPSRRPGSGRASAERGALQQGHREAAASGSRPASAASTRRAGRATRPRKPIATDTSWPSTVSLMSWAQRGGAAIAGAAPRSRNAETTAITMVRASEGRRGTRGGYVRQPRAPREPELGSFRRNDARGPFRGASATSARPMAIAATVPSRSPADRFVGVLADRGGWSRSTPSTSSIERSPAADTHMSAAVWRETLVLASSNRSRSLKLARDGRRK